MKAKLISIEISRLGLEEYDDGSADLLLIQVDSHGYRVLLNEATMAELSAYFRRTRP